MLANNLAQYKRSGLVRKARHLLDNIDNVLTCMNLDRGLPLGGFQNLSSLLKLNLYDDDIKEASSDPEISEIVSVAKFLLQNEYFLYDGNTNETNARQLRAYNNRATDITYISSDSDDDELPHIPFPIKSRRVIGIGGFHAYRPPPYSRVRTATATATTSAVSSTTKSACTSQLCQQNWSKRLEELSKQHEKELCRVRAESRTEVRNELLECVICLNDTKEYTLVPCGHTFCKDCTRRMKSANTCFFCRSTINMCVKVRLTD